MSYAALDLHSLYPLGITNMGNLLLHSPERYDPWDAPENWDAFQEELVLSAFEPGARVIEVGAFATHWRQWPLCVKVETPSGDRQTIVLKADPQLGGVELEVELLPVLQDLGLRVPKILSGPVVHPDYPNAGPIVVRNWLSGDTLRYRNGTAAELDLVCKLLFEGVTRLSRMTDAIHKHEIGRKLPRKTLAWELRCIEQRGSWLDYPLCAEALRRLRRALPHIKTPLVFGNGDCNLNNFLTDWRHVTGYIDFCLAGLRDPHIGFGKYVVWAFDRNWAPFSQAGLVERWLYMNGVSRAEFAPRLALCCLDRLQADLSNPDSDEYADRYRNHVLALLEECVELMAAGS